MKTCGTDISACRSCRAVVKVTVKMIQNFTKPLLTLLLRSQQHRLEIDRQTISKQQNAMTNKSTPVTAVATV